MLIAIVGLLALIALKLFQSTKKQKRAPMSAKRAKELTYANR